MVFADEFLADDFRNRAPIPSSQSGTDHRLSKLGSHVGCIRDQLVRWQAPPIAMQQPPTRPRIPRRATELVERAQWNQRADRLARICFRALLHVFAMHMAPARDLHRHSLSGRTIRAMSRALQRLDLTSPHQDG